MKTQSKIVVVGCGPGSREDLTPAAEKAIREADVIVGYKYYMPFIEDLADSNAEIYESGMRMEEERVAYAIERAKEGKNVVVVSSGESGMYGMAPLVYEMYDRERTNGETHKSTLQQNDKLTNPDHSDNLDNLNISVVPGISAFQKAASLLGAPIGHDLCTISLSDLLTPWPTIEKRIKAAADADFVTAIYNPRSEGRFWQLERLKEIFLQHRQLGTPVGIVRQAGRDEESVEITTLNELDCTKADMFTTLIIGNSKTYLSQNNSREVMITPRGYFSNSVAGDKMQGRDIMRESFARILKELENPFRSKDELWPILHAIHTTADFEMERVIKADIGAVAKLYEKFKDGTIKKIVTDVTMVKAGIRKAACEELGVEVICLLDNPEALEMSEKLKITRSKAAIRVAVKHYPEALYVFGNAPTALSELAQQIARGNASPAGIIAAPVGFVNVEESKHMIKPFTNIPKIIAEGRKGGSNLAATLVNSILSFEDAKEMNPGRHI